MNLHLNYVKSPSSRDCFALLLLFWFSGLWWCGIGARNLYLWKLLEFMMPYQVGNYKSGPTLVFSWQGLKIYGHWARFILPSVFVNKILLKLSHKYSFMYWVSRILQLSSWGSENIKSLVSSPVPKMCADFHDRTKAVYFEVIIFVCVVSIRLETRYEISTSYVQCMWLYLIFLSPQKLC